MLTLTQVTNIPTITSFLARPDGLALGTLETHGMISKFHEACHYCHRLLPSIKFSNFQYLATFERQKSRNFEYKTWRPERHFCRACGFREGFYNQVQADASYRTTRKYHW